MSVQLVPYFKRLITDQLGILLMNHAPGEYLSDIQMFFTNATQVNIMKTRPRLFLNTPRYRRARLRLWELADTVIAEHRSRTPTAEQRDIVDDALDARDENGNVYPADFLRAVVLGTFTAGIDSLALTCSFAVYALLKHPGVWDRVRAEVLPVFKDRIPTMNEIRRLDVLHAAMLEILRFYTVTPGTPRIAVEAFDFEGFHVPKDTNILVGTAVTHFLPKFFPNPMQFEINRFIEPRHEHRQAHAFAPFALGEHTCLGAGMAEIQAMVIIGTLISNVNLELSPGYKLRIQAAPTRGPQADLTVY
jgi:cytochrome P450